MGILNEDKPTRVTKDRSMAPDLSIATTSILPTCTWATITSLSSDHLPIVIMLITEVQKFKPQT